MTGADLAALYGPTSRELLAQLIVAVDGTAAAVQTLHADPTPEKGEAMAYRFRALEELTKRITVRLDLEVRQG